MPGNNCNILVTGGTGFIGSHTVVEMLNVGYNVTIIDNLVNSSLKVLDRIEELTKETRQSKGYANELTFKKVDLMDEDGLRKVFEEAKEQGRLFRSVIHFAGLKAVGESVQQPLRYYENNLTGTMRLLRVMDEYDVRQIVFSSSATVYGTSEPPFTENSRAGVGISNPYGWTKFMLETILSDVYKSDPDRWGVCLLRYFNPVGAHPSGRIGEDPQGMPNNLMPFVQQVMTGRRDKLTVFGSDYPTEDGTAERDYIHVVDLAKGHLAALDWLKDKAGTGCEIFNLGTGNKSSVLDVVKAYGRAAAKDVPYVIGDRREGDLPFVYCVPEKAEKELGWKATHTLEDMCRDSWRWCSKNPYGYEGEEK